MKIDTWLDIYKQLLDNFMTSGYKEKKHLVKKQDQHVLRDFNTTQVAISSQMTSITILIVD